jgi:hypothetical protein
MTTEAAIHKYRQDAIGKMVRRLESVDLTIIDAHSAEGDAYMLFGSNAETDSGAIYARGGVEYWSFPQLQELIAKIAMFGRPTMYRLTVKGTISMSRATIAVPAGEFAQECAGDIARRLGNEIHELIEVRNVQH